MVVQKDSALLAFSAVFKSFNAEKKQDYSFAGHKSTEPIKRVDKGGEPDKVQFLVGVGGSKFCLFRLPPI